MNGNTDDVMTLRPREIEETFLLSINKGYGHYIWTIRSQRDINSEKTSSLKLRSQWINNDLNASDDVMIVISRVLNNSLNKYYGHHI